MRMRWPDLDPGRHVDPVLLLGVLAAEAGADLAGLLGDPAVAAATVAGGRADHLAEGGVGDGPQLAGSLATVAGADRCARLGPVAMAVLAVGDRLEGNLPAGAVEHVFEFNRSLDPDVRARGRATGAAETAAAEEGAEEVVDRTEALGPGLIPAGAQAVVAVLVVGLPPAPRRKAPRRPRRLP